MRETKIIGVWRSWLAHLVWDQRVLCSSHSTPTFSESNYLDFKWLLFSYSVLCYAILFLLTLHVESKIRRYDKN